MKAASAVRAAAGIVLCRYTVVAHGLLEGHRPRHLRRRLQHRALARTRDTESARVRHQGMSDAVMHVQVSRRQTCTETPGAAVSPESGSVADDTVSRVVAGAAGAGLPGSPSSSTSTAAGGGGGGGEDEGEGGGGCTRLDARGPPAAVSGTVGGGVSVAVTATPLPETSAGTG